MAPPSSSPSRKKRQDRAAGERDKRKARRRDVRYPAAIECIEDGRSIPVVIQDASQTGAKLMAAEDAEVPAAFILRLGHTRAASRHCRLIWRDGAKFGVAFVEPAAE